MTRTELLSLESDHKKLVEAIMACAKVGSGRIELEIDKTELGLIARALQAKLVKTAAQKWWMSYDTYRLELAYLEIDINLYAKVVIR